MSGTKKLMICFLFFSAYPQTVMKNSRISLWCTPVDDEKQIACRCSQIFLRTIPSIMFQIFQRATCHWKSKDTDSCQIQFLKNRDFRSLCQRFQRGWKRGPSQAYVRPRTHFCWNYLRTAMNFEIGRRYRVCLCIDNRQHLCLILPLSVFSAISSNFWGDIWVRTCSSDGEFGQI